MKHLLLLVFSVLVITGCTLISIKLTTSQITDVGDGTVDDYTAETTDSTSDEVAVSIPLNKE